MENKFDPAKDAKNQAKHGISLAAADELDWSTVRVTEDQRRPYGEPRQIGYGLLGDRLYCVVFVQRDEVRRIISFRKANNREIKRYEAQN